MENASLEERRSCGWSGTFYEQSSCSISGSAFSRCSECSALAFRFQSILASNLSFSFSMG
ncbi:hypothetical protein GGI42DRAFT_330424 [Trichoderma sp. SZMC 28013]